MSIKVWTIENTAAEALGLPEGRFAANFGFLVEQSVSPDSVLEAATALIQNKVSVTVASQAAILVKAKEAGVALDSWAPLQLL